MFQFTFRTANFADETDFISLDILGKCLQTIAMRQGRLIFIKVKDYFMYYYNIETQRQREFLKPFEQGTPNLVITPAGTLFKFMFICTSSIR